MKILSKILGCVLLLVLITLVGNPHAFAAEVYYLGQGDKTMGGIEGTTPVRPSFTLKKRAEDLLDFKSYGNFSPERSGWITGNISNEVDYTNVSGNKSKSFYREGVDYNTEANVNVQEKLWRDYNFEGAAFLRKTDDVRIESRRDMRLKYLNAKVINPDNLVEFGNFYSDFSDFVTSSSLEGFNTEITPVRPVKVRGILARKYSDDIAADRYQRNVFGGKVDWTAFSQSALFSLFRMGVQTASSQDDSSTKSNSTNTVDLNNTVTSFDGDINFVKYLTFNYELARSWYQADESKFGDGDLKHGYALRLQPGLNLGDKVYLRYLYYDVQPNFYTEVGSAMPDKRQNQFSADISFTSRIRLSLTQNWYWDHLNESPLAYRTFNDEKYASLYVRPLESRNTLYLRPYVNFLTRDSDEPSNLVKSHTTTTGFSVNDTIWNTNAGLRYEFREDENKPSQTSSTWFNRFGASLGRDLQLFKRRLYFSTDYSFDDRRVKSDNNDDFSSGLMLDAQYDIFSFLALRGGYNLQHFNGGPAMTDYRNTRNFFEADFLVHRKRNTHFVTRFEHNFFNHEDGTQKYEELRVVSKMTSQF